MSENEVDPMGVMCDADGHPWYDVTRWEDLGWTWEYCDIEHVRAAGQEGGTLVGWRVFSVPHDCANGQPLLVLCPSCAQQELVQARTAP